MKKYFFIRLVLLLLSINSVAQNLDLGSWNILNAKYTLDKKWSGFAEAQIRSLKFYDNFHYYEYKFGLNYKILNNLQATLGAGSYQTFKEGGNFVRPKNNDEFRIFPQLVLFQSIGNFIIEQRYRTELRFTSNGYKNRFRYRLGVLYPFGKQNDNYKPYQISASNELFFSDGEPYFERNRILFTFNYKPIKKITLQIGYVHQFDYKIDDETGRDFVQIGLYFELYKKNVSNLKTSPEIKDN